MELRRTCWTGVMLSDLVGLMDRGGTGASLELCTEYVGSGYLWNSDPDWYVWYGNGCDVFTGCNMVERTWRSVCGYGILVVYLSDKEVTSLVSCEHVSE